MPLPVATPVAAAEYDSPAVRTARARERAVARTRSRSRWWWAPLAAAVLLSGLWGLLRADQFLSGVLVWPRQGARFVEISDTLPTATTSSTHGGSMTVVISGLNTKSGTAVATALLPALTVDGGRVFSLVYGSGIADDDLIGKYDALVAAVRPESVTFFGSSMGGDIALNLAAHAHHLRQQQVRALSAAARDDLDLRVAPARATSGWAVAADGLPGWTDRSVPNPGPSGWTDRSAATGPSPGSAQGSVIAPRVDVVYLDSTPLGADDVRDRSRTSADVLTSLTEAAGTDGGAATRLLVEVMAQRRQWSSGLWPTPTVRGDDLLYKYRQVMREKIGAPGISTALVKDQYGVIRRMDSDARFTELGDGAEPVRVVYFRPAVAAADTVVAVERVTAELGRWAATGDLEIRVVGVPDGHHAAAQTIPGPYLEALADPSPGTRLTGGPGESDVLALGPR